ncbi:polysaccharide biosynthesis/export family protein [Mucilaginibacter sp. X5P1]|uniref:polysaccharide biosynthesis/export family protein n=1 Tax=Mucilaginibacter sp. X5P1 TaxID=2723088 RepID=UPI0016150E9F|nr:polysaccharide biosynthesis/export family protein [Mucilaginibacter sp. X5P1]MBB6141034.1 polysaccharide export outer membrane protein [Mucilaginibacter sp. X5P1]
MNRTCTRFLIFTYLVLGTALILTSCSYKQDQILFEQRASLADIAKPKDSATLESYRIKPQDILQIRNLQSMSYIVGDMGSQGASPTSSSSTSSSSSSGSTSQGQTYQVEVDGNVALPVIGHIQVAGLTRIEASNKIEALYREKLLKDPIIELKIVNLQVTMLGEIKAQGNYPLVKDKTTLVEMIGQAGGLTDKANEKNIKIIRGNPKKPEITEVDLGSVTSLSDPATILQNGDIIYIAQNKRAVKSDKLQSFSTVIQPVLLLVNTALIIFTLTRK